MEKKNCRRRAFLKRKQMEVLQLFILGLIPLMVSAEDPPQPNCTRTCGSITNIEYPFGIEDGCFRVGFNLSCVNDQTTNFTPTLLLADGTIKVKQIYIEWGALFIEPLIITMDVNERYTDTLMIDLKKWPYAFNLQFDKGLFGYVYPIATNLVYVVGCSAIANLIDLNANNTYISTCSAVCSTNSSTQQELSHGNGGCFLDFYQVNTTSLGIQLVRLNETELHLVNTSSVMAAMYSHYTTTGEDNQELIIKGNTTGMVATLGWYINDGHRTCKEAKKNNSTYACRSLDSDCYDTYYDGNLYGNSTSLGYICRCSSGYLGNPYLVHGCQDLNFTLYPKKECVRKCGSMKIPFPFGLENGCYRDESFHLQCNETNHLKFEGLDEIVTGISIEEGQLELDVRYGYTTNKLGIYALAGTQKLIYSWVIAYQSCEIARKINSTTYACVDRNSECIEVKGTGIDENIIGYRCKCSKGYEGNPYLVDGCTDIDECSYPAKYACYGTCENVEGDYNCTCPTGSSSGDPKQRACIPEPKNSILLRDHLHISNGNSALSWEDRLRIATEAAGALAYLHSAASMSILHRDVKSSNILLDDHFTAKVSDFGASRFIPLDQTHIITAVQGTFGYLDPEYYQTSKLTEKSDVYSFGIILLELLTGKKPLYTTEDGQDLNLSMHFLQATREDHPFDLVEDRVIKESNDHELNEIFQLVKMCLKLKGDDRPTM